MAKMYALRTIIRQNDDDVQEQIARRTVFDCKPAEARQLDALGAARPATDAEIADHKAAQAKLDGSFYERVVGVVDAETPNSEPAVTAAPEVPANVSGAEGDPTAIPKGRRG